MNSHSLKDRDFIHETTSRGPLLLLGAVMVFGFVAFTVWISLLLLFFTNSTEYWPGFACAVPAGIVGGLAARFVLDRGFYRHISASAVIAVTAAVFAILLVTTVIMVKADEAERILLPRAVDAANPGNWILLGTLLLGMISGAQGTAFGVDRQQFLNSMLAFVGGCICGGMLVLGACHYALACAAGW